MILLFFVVCFSEGEMNNANDFSCFALSYYFACSLLPPLFCFVCFFNLLCCALVSLFFFATFFV